MAGWRFGAGERDQPGLLFTVEDAGSGRSIAWLAPEHRVETLFHQPLAGSVDGRQAGVEGRHDTLVTPALARAGHIRLEQDAGLEDLTGRMTTCVNDRLKFLAFFRAQPDDVLPVLDLRHDPIPDNDERRCKRVMNGCRIQ